MQENDVDRVLDVVELSFVLMNVEVADKAAGAIEELNTRFREHTIGYRLEYSKIVRIDSELIHSEVVKPALRLLEGAAYSGAREEFLKAHEHHRHGNQKEALNDCLKALESVMKSICTKRGWAYSPTDTAKGLIDICFQKGLIPSFWQGQFSSLRSLLESSVPTGRNKLSGHGQGPNPTSVPQYLAAYMIHMTASAIVFLAEAEKESSRLLTPTR